MEQEYFISHLHDARITRVDRASNVLTIQFDCSDTPAYHPSCNIQQLRFFDYRIIEDADLTGCWWIKAFVASKKPSSTAHTLELMVETPKCKHKRFVLRFHRVEAVPFSEDT